jgi:hypothetical protein
VYDKVRHSIAMRELIIGSQLARLHRMSNVTLPVARTPRVFDFGVSSCLRPFDEEGREGGNVEMAKDAVFYLWVLTELLPGRDLGKVIQESPDIGLQNQLNVKREHAVSILQQLARFMSGTRSLDLATIHPSSSHMNSSTLLVGTLFSLHPLVA